MEIVEMDDTRIVWSFDTLEELAAFEKILICVGAMKGWETIHGNVKLELIFEKSEAISQSEMLEQMQSTKDFLEMQ